MIEVILYEDKTSSLLVPMVTLNGGPSLTLTKPKETNNQK
jgi:hypothetical protein